MICIANVKHRKYVIVTIYDIYKSIYLHVRLQTTFHSLNSCIQVLNTLHFAFSNPNNGNECNDVRSSGENAAIQCNTHKTQHYNMILVNNPTQEQEGAVTKLSLPTAIQPQNHENLFNQVSRSRVD